MTHEDRGHYAAKHTGKKINQAIAKKLQALAVDGCVDCASAHQAAKAFNTTPGEIGVQVDLLEYRIMTCQLGMFGYEGRRKKIDPDIDISPELDKLIDQTAKDGRLSCKQCWDIAKTLKIKRLDLGSACEKKNIRIKPCQLGAF